MRRAAKVDTHQQEIVDGLRYAGVKCWYIKLPCDLLCRFYSPRFGAWIWQTLEVKTPYGKKAKPKVDKRQDKQIEFLRESETPIVTSLTEALSALGITPSA